MPVKSVETTHLYLTHTQLACKYPQGTPHWRKSRVERYICSEHGELTIFVRDSQIPVGVHVASDSECSKGLPGL